MFLYLDFAARCYSSSIKYIYAIALACYAIASACYAIASVCYAIASVCYAIASVCYAIASACYAIASVCYAIVSSESDSDQAQAIGLKKKSDRKRPSRKKLVVVTS